jgi:hypothetical protein
VFFFTLCLQCFQSWICWLMFFMFFIGLVFLFHRSIVGISCFVGLMYVGVKWMYVACVSQILSVKFHV